MKDSKSKTRSLPPHPQRLTDRKTTGFTPRPIINVDSELGQSSREISRPDPRDQCCHGGRVFLDAIKAMVSRMMLMLHSVLMTWRVTALLGPAFWCLAVVTLVQLVEAVVVLLYRKGKDWKWFSPCVFIYLLSVVPGIWIMDLENYRRSQEELSQTNATEVEASAVESDDWKMLLEQSMLLVIIISRWLMPKGDMSRDQLSALLLGYVGTASDSVDFVALLTEKTFDLTFRCVVLTFYSVSLFQFVFIKTVVGDGDADEDYLDDEDAEEEKGGDRGKGKQTVKKKRSTEGESKKKTSCGKELRKTIINRILKTEIWAIFVTLFMQDGPFFFIRVSATGVHDVVSRTHFFFTAKNAILIALQLYRLFAVYKEYKAEEAQAKEKRKELWRQFYKNVNYMNAFSLDVNKIRDVEQINFTQTNGLPEPSI